MKLSHRKENILAHVVEYYIPTGEPVGSKALSEELGYSSATIRNERSELCELGFLEKNHASSGRIPTSFSRPAVSSSLGAASLPSKTVEQISLPSRPKTLVSRS